MRRCPARGLLAVLLAGTVGCYTSSYAPRPDGRVAVVIDHGRMMLAKDGKLSPSRELGEVVAGNPVAEEHARTYGRKLRLDLIYSAGGLAGVIGGALLISARPSDAGTSKGVGDGRIVGGSVLLLAGMAALVTSIFYTAGAGPHFWDTINAYNSGVTVSAPGAAGAAGH